MRRPRKRKKEDGKKLSLATINHDRAADLCDSLFQVLAVESKYSTYNNQQLAMAVGMLLNKIKGQRSREAWIYIKAIVMAELEDPILELSTNTSLTNKLSKPNEKKSPTRRPRKARGPVTSETKKET